MEQRSDSTSFISHKGCHSPIRYQEVCPIHGELSSDEIVSGYQYAKGQYVEIDPDEVSKIQAVSDKSINIDGFISTGKLDSAYYKGRTYYLVPDRSVDQKPYALLHKAMTDRDVHAIAQIVLSGKEQLVLIRPLENLLAMSVLSFDAQVKKPESFDDELVETPLSKQEIDLTKTLIDATTKDTVDYSDYKDTYVNSSRESSGRRSKARRSSRRRSSRKPKSSISWTP